MSDVVALHPRRALNVISLCTGGGGLDRSLQLVLPDAHPVLCVEREAFAIASLVAQIEAGLMAPAAIWSDVRTVRGRPLRALRRLRLLEVHAGDVLMSGEGLSAANRELLIEIFSEQPPFAKHLLGDLNRLLDAARAQGREWLGKPRGARVGDRLWLEAEVIEIDEAGDVWVERTDARWSPMRITPMTRYLAAAPPAPEVEGWTRETLGRAIYMGLYGHQGAVWAANDSKEVWYACADKVLAAATQAPEAGWRPIETAPCGRDFLAINAKGDIQRCWRHKPSSRTDEILRFATNAKFAAVAWMPLPSPPSTAGEG